MNETPPHFRPPLAETNANERYRPEIVQYIIKDIEDNELDRAIDARSASQLIEGRWRGAVVVLPDGSMIRGWMNLSIMLIETEVAQIVVDGLPVGSVEVGPDP